MDPDSTLPCALYLSPNGRTFRLIQFWVLSSVTFTFLCFISLETNYINKHSYRTKKEVDDFEAILEEGRRMKRQKKMEKAKGSLVKTSEEKSAKKIENSSQEKQLLLPVDHPCF